MCGLCALYAYTGKAPRIDPARLKTVNDAMVRRGPDGAGEWVSADGRVGLGHRRLAIIDLSPAGAQPMALVNGGEPARYHITYNGEIYNFRVLRDELAQQGVTFVSESDTEVILRLYERDGADMLPRLRGMFALAIWDAAERTLFVARDAYGIKPLYYADDGRTFACASSVKALLAGGGIDTSPDPAGHAGFFLTGSVPDPHTLFAGIRALGAGAWMKVKPDGERESGRYLDVEGLLAETPDDPVPDLRDVLLDSVRHHFVADVPVGVFLSAGLDSTSITALAAECRGEGLETITLGFDEFAGKAGDEAPLAEDVARLYGADHRTERVSQADFDDAHDDILDVMDQPSIDGVNTYFVSRVARRRGLKVALSGLGGDELFGGYDTFARVPDMVSKVGAAPGAAGFGKLVRVLAGPLIGALTSPKAAGVLELGGTYGGAWLLRRGLFMPWELGRVMDPDLARAGLAELSLVGKLNRSADRAPTPLRKVAALETAYYMRNQLLRDSDWAGMANSLEIRVPLVDPVVLKSLLPLVLKTGGPGKRDMAKTPSTPLPDAVVNRPKTGFFIPVERWLRERGGGNERGLRGWAKTVYASASSISK